MPSYSPVFSQAFILYTHSTPNQSFDVPVGYTAVVRQISGAQEIGGWYMYLILQDSAAAPGVIVAVTEADGVVNAADKEGRWVVPGGGIITIAFSQLGTEPSFYVGGYLLRNTLS